jgi:DNA-binding transcriptional regulator GbsR (MarR family)
MSEIPLNKYEKEKRVIEMHLAGRTIREIAKELHMSFTSISKIIKAYERKAKREESNQSSQPKKPPITTQAFKLFRDGENLTDTTISLQIPAAKAEKLWEQFLKLQRMYECYEFYQVFQYQIPELLAISSFIRKNNGDTRNISRILKEATDVYHLQSYRTEIKNEIERLKQTKNNYTLNQNMQPVPLGLLPRYYNW